MPTYSHSRISTFETCRLQFKYHYIDRQETEQEDTVETFLGSLVHEALERLYKDLQHEKKDTKEDLLSWFNGQWVRRWNDETIKIVRDEYSEDNYREMGVRFLSDYYDRYAPFDQGRTIGLETQDMLDLGDGVKYHVRIDRLTDAGNGVYEIHDYKTNGRLKTLEELEQDRQLAMYAYWVHRAYPDAQRVRLIWHFLAFDKEMVVEKTTDHLEGLKGRILEKVREIEACTDFPPSRSALCKWCAYQRICPLWKHRFDTDDLAPEEFKREDGVRLVDGYARLKAEEAELKTKLGAVQQDIYAYAEQHGVKALYGSAHRLTLWSKEVVKLPGKNDPGQAFLVGRLKELGLFDEYAMLDSWKLADALSTGKVVIGGYSPTRETVRRIYLNTR